MPDARDAEDSRRNKKDMKIKKLAVEEKGRTRALWEEVFSEDTREFLDYYYFIKTRDNDIYVIEDCLLYTSNQTLSWNCGSDRSAGADSI